MHSSLIYRAVLALVPLGLSACGSASLPPAPAAHVQTDGQRNLETAESLVASVRAMAARDNLPIAGTALAAEVASRGGGADATCADYAITLRALLSSAGLESRLAGVAFNPGLDSHELVELHDVDTGRWIALDPTFGLIPISAGGDPASVDELHQAARAMAWSTITYQFVTPQQDAWARAYYLDYPTLFLNIVDSQTGVPTEPLVPLTPYLTYLGTTTTERGFYVTPCDSGPDCSDGYTAVVLYPVGFSNAAGIYTPTRFVYAYVPPPG